MTKRDKLFGTTRRTNKERAARKPGAFQHTGFKIKHGKKVPKNERPAK